MGRLIAYFSTKASYTFLSMSSSRKVIWLIRIIVYHVCRIWIQRGIGVLKNLHRRRHCHWHCSWILIRIWILSKVNILLRSSESSKILQLKVVLLLLRSLKDLFSFFLFQVGFLFTFKTDLVTIRKVFVHFLLFFGQGPPACPHDGSDLSELCVWILKQDLRSHVKGKENFRVIIGKK